MSCPAATHSVCIARVRMVHALCQLSFARDVWDIEEVIKAGGTWRSRVFVRSSGCQDRRLGFVSVIWHRWMQGCSVQERKIWR